ncbi:MAG: porin, partial [Burkholderiaceae bacterium]|nr:porin [Burkholderiaceae bacterium]
MKKTLIAMAAVAVAGVASAQVSITGALGFGYTKDDDAKGYRITDGVVKFNAAEDLGGGMTLSGSTTVDLKGRTSVNAENASLTMSGGFGSVTLGSVEAGNGILGLGGAGAAGRGLDNGTALDGGTNGDMLKYTTPALMTGLTASITRFEAGTGAGDGAAQVTVVGVNFSSGALTVAADTANYAQPAAKAVAATTAVCTGETAISYAAHGTACPTGTAMIAPAVKAADEATVLAAQVDQRQRISFSYDLGMAK